MPVVTSLQEGSYVFGSVCLFDCLSAGLLKKLWTNFDECYGGISGGPRTKWLDFGGVPRIMIHIRIRNPELKRIGRVLCCPSLSSFLIDLSQAKTFKYLTLVFIIFGSPVTWRSRPNTTRIFRHDGGEGKGPVFDIALLHDEHMLRSALQSQKWQLIGLR